MGFTFGGFSLGREAERLYCEAYIYFFKVDKFMIYLRQKRQMKKGTFPLELKATRSVMHLWPLRSLFKGLRLIFLVNSAQMSFLLIVRVMYQRRKAGNSHVHACTSL